MSVDCELAQALKKKFRFLEKRVTFLEEKSKRDEKVIKKLKRKRKMDLEKFEKAIKELKTGNGYTSTQEFVESVDFDVMPEPEQSTLIIQQVESLQNQKNDRLESINGGYDLIISQNLVEQIIDGENDTEKSQEQEVLNSVENSDGNVHEYEICTSKIDSNLPGANIGVISSKPKEPLKKSKICTFCSKSFRDNSKLSDHMRIHTGDRHYKCQICSKSFTTMYNLKTHTRLHTGEKPYSCSVCSKSFTQTSSLQYHMSIHKGTYSCTICSKKLGSKSFLKIHKRTHTGERPYECTYCNEKFVNPSVLKYHMSKHSGTYSCSICSKKFGSKAHLKIHKRIHTGERPYECTKCKKKFIQLGNLVNHNHRKNHLNCQQE